MNWIYQGHFYNQTFSLIKFKYIQQCIFTWCKIIDITNNNVKNTKLWNEIVFFGMTINKIYILVNEKKRKHVYTTSNTTIAPMFLLTSIIKQDNANKMEVNSSLDWIIWKMIESHCLSWLSQFYNNITNCLHKVPYFALVLCHHEIQCGHKHFCNKDLLKYHDPQNYWQTSLALQQFQKILQQNSNWIKFVWCPW